MSDTQTATYHAHCSAAKPFMQAMWVDLSKCLSEVVALHGSSTQSGGCIWISGDCGLVCCRRAETGYLVATASVPLAPERRRVSNRGEPLMSILSSMYSLSNPFSQNALFLYPCVRFYCAAY